MKHFLQLLSVATITGFCSALAGQPDARFEGVWVGSETFQATANFMQKGQTVTKPALNCDCGPKKRGGS
jgi:hypothetical protein